MLFKLSLKTELLPLSGRHNHSYNDVLWVYNGTWFEAWKKGWVRGFDEYVDANEQLSVHAMHLEAEWETVPAPADKSEELQRWRDTLELNRLQEKLGGKECSLREYT